MQDQGVRWRWSMALNSRTHGSLQNGRQRSMLTVSLQTLRFYYRRRLLDRGVAPTAHTISWRVSARISVLCGDIMSALLRTRVRNSRVKAGKAHPEWYRHSRLDCAPVPTWDQEPILGSAFCKLSPPRISFWQGKRAEQRYCCRAHCCATRYLRPFCCKS